MIVLDLKSPQPLPLKMRDNGEEFELLEAIKVNLASEHCPLWVEVPQGYVTDLATIPPEVAIFGFEKLGRHSYAAIIHDWMFTKQMGYELSNAAFYSLLRASGVTQWKAAVMAFFCEAGGKSRYKKCGKLLEKGTAH